MGGSALDVDNKRLTSHEFDQVSRDLSERLVLMDAVANTHVVQYVREKETHGDIDILVQLQGPRQAVEVQMANHVLQATDMYKNGPSTSMDTVWRVQGPGGSTYRTDPIQVDLVFVPENQWAMTKTFFDWNDLGNLLGKVARYHRYKLGFQGLRISYWYDFDKSEKLGDYTVTRDPEEALEFLGYDYERHREGFDAFEEMFEYALSSEKAVPLAFQSAQLNASQRRRDLKREVYQQFMSWLSRQRPHEHLPRPSPRAALEKAEAAFPEANLREQIQEDKAEVRRKKAAAEVFNGGDIHEELGLEGKDVGIVLNKLIQRGRKDYGSYHTYRLLNGRSEMLSMADLYARNASEVDYP
jgi:hypothetical protein